MTIYYVTHDAAGGGTGLSVSSPMTIPEAEGVAAAGDEIRLCNTGTYLPTAQIIWDGSPNLSTANAPIYVSGYSADGTTPEQVTLDGNSLAASNDLFRFTSGSPTYMIFRDIRFYRSKQYAINVQGVLHAEFFDCLFDTSASHGLYGTGSTNSLKAERCYFLNNIGSGFFSSTAGRGGLHAIHCIFEGNGTGSTDGPRNTYYTKPIYDHCFFIRNTNDGLKIINDATYGNIFVRNCTFFSNGGDGLDISNSGIARIDIEGNIFCSNGTSGIVYGINMAGGTSDKYLNCRNNCFYGNFTAPVDVNGGVCYGTGHVYEDPNFVSTTSGSENLTPQNTNLQSTYSYLRGGTTYSYIGAIQPPLPNQNVGVVVVGI